MNYEKTVDGILSENVIFLFYRKIIFFELTSKIRDKTGLCTYAKGTGNN
jgi:hypothetical protein